MNVIELLTLVGFIVSAFLAGRWLGGSMNLWGWLLGATIGLIGWSFLYLTARYLINTLEKSFPARPLCQNGKCRAIDYEFLGMRDDGAELQCKCGDRYLAKGNRFFVFETDGSLRTYMRRAHSFAHWKNAPPSKTSSAC